MFFPTSFLHFSLHYCLRKSLFRSKCQTYRSLTSERADVSAEQSDHWKGQFCHDRRGQNFIFCASPGLQEDKLTFSRCKDKKQDKRHSQLCGDITYLYMPYVSLSPVDIMWSELISTWKWSLTNSFVKCTWVLWLIMKHTNVWYPWDELNLLSAAIETESLDHMTVMWQVLQWRSCDLWVIIKYKPGIEKGNRLSDRDFIRYML